MNDPTYDKEVIDANPVWELAFMISEMTNDNAPIGWSGNIMLAGMLIDKYTITLRVKS